MNIRKHIAVALGAAALATAPHVSVAKDIVVSTASPTTEDYAMSVVWSNLVANVERHN